MIPTTQSAEERTREEKTQKKNDRKRMQKQRRAERRLLVCSDVVSTSSGINDTIASQTDPSPRTTDIPSASQRSAWESIVDNFVATLDPATQEYIAVNDVDGTWADLFSLALHHGWNAGWERGRETGGLGRREGIAVGREMGPEVPIVQSPPLPPPPVVQTFTDSGIQTDPPAPDAPSPSFAIPQELIDAIVCQLDDNESLKACTVVSSGFRGASQRILLSSLTLNGHQDSTVCTRLAESPHVVAYIKRLKIKLPSARYDPSEIQSLHRVLAQLTAVRECIIQGVSSDARWGDLTPPLSEALLDFIARQGLHSLRLCTIKDIPRAVVHRLITSAPMLCFFQTYLEPAVDLAAVPPNSFSIQTLLLDPQSTSFAVLLSRPQFSVHTAHLLRLSVVFGDSMSMNMICATARTLQYLRVDCTHLTSPYIPIVFPALRSLRSLELVLHFSDATAPWFIDIISRIVASDAECQPAKVNQLIVSFSPASDIRPVSYPNKFPAALEKCLLSHPTIPRLRWRLWFRAGNEERFAHFSAFIRNAMPKMHARGKLAVEPFAPDWNGLTKCFWT
ncbi:hypothetical protein DFH09DRAFT_1356906 [Mycena vulgaris]|nr:hypothetical protein DFH09DRAFT_1356906 [Mycena vulgaris]